MKKLIFGLLVLLSFSATAQKENLITNKGKIVQQEKYDSVAVRNLINTKLAITDTTGKWIYNIIIRNDSFFFGKGGTQNFVGKVQTVTPTLQTILTSNNKTTKSIWVNKLFVGDTLSNNITVDSVSGIGFGYAKNTSTIKSSNYGAFSGGYAGAYTTTNSKIEATGVGSFAQGTLRDSGTISATYDGSFAQGSTYGGKILSTNYGSFAQGFANVTTAQAGTIQSTGIGSTAQGYASSLGVMTSSGFGSTARGVAQRRGIMISSGPGSVASGYASTNSIDSSRIISSINAAHTFGFAENGGQLINSSSGGLLAGGAGNNGKMLLSSAHGGILMGYSWSSDAYMSNAGEGALVGGLATNDSIYNTINGEASLIWGRNLKNSGKNSYLFGRTLVNNNDSNIYMGYGSPALAILGRNNNVSIGTSSPASTTTFTVNSTTSTKLIDLVGASGQSRLFVNTAGGGGFSTRNSQFSIGIIDAGLNASTRFLTLGSGKSYIDGYSEGSAKSSNYDLVIGSRGKNLNAAITGNTIFDDGTNVQIGFETSTVPSSILTLNSLKRGLLLPRLTNAQMLAISSPATGLLVFNSDSNTIHGYNGSNWQKYLTANSAGNVGIGTTTPTSTLHVAGSVAMAYTKVEENNYEISATDYTLSVANGNNDWTIYLPIAANCIGRVYVIKRFDGDSTGELIIAAIDCKVQNHISGVFESAVSLGKWDNKEICTVMYQSNGTNWEVIKN